jgi:hypothetical protein
MSKRIYKIEVDNDGYSVMFKHKGLPIWFDFWQSKDENLDEDDRWQGDWNMYIFDLYNSNDLIIRKFQNNPDNFTNCFSNGLDYVLSYIKKNNTK